MKKLKFRIWDEDTKQMEFRTMETICQFGWPLQATRSFPIMRSTGLSDRLGKEIYEGDIIRRTMHYYVGEAEEGVSEVKWVKDEGSQFVGFSFFPSDDINKLEIIGNIYENPEKMNGR